MFLFSDNIVRSTQDEVDALNHEKARNLFPAFMMDMFVIIMGLFGNPLVIYFFGIRLPAKTSHAFITALAVYDLIISCIMTPYDAVVSINHYYSRLNIYVCKLQIFVSYFADCAGGFLIFAVAVERFRAIRKRKTTSLKAARIIIILVTVWSALISLPALVSYRIIQVNETGTYNATGHTCNWFSHGYQNRLPFSIYFIVLLLMLIIFESVMITLYCFVYKEVKNNHSRESARYTLVMICITVCFILTYLPYLIVHVWRAFDPHGTYYNLHSNGSTQEILLRTVYLDSAINPIIYGFLNAGFKDFVFSLVRKMCCCLYPKGPTLPLDDVLETDREETRKLLP